MTIDQIIVIFVLVSALILFAWGRYRYDLVGMYALCCVTITGLVDINEAFSGFGHPAVITVACVLIISHALQNSGLVDVVAAKLSKYTKNVYIHVFSLTTMVTVASAFMNNVGALALMLPIAIATAKEHNRSPALLLMPLSFGSILGGMTTLIGTPPNIIISAYRSEIGLGDYAMFDFTQVGAIVAGVGVLYIGFLGWHFIPKARRQKKTTQQTFQLSEYLTEIKITENSKIVGKMLSSIPALNSETVEVIGIAKGSGRAQEPYKHHILTKDDVLILRSDSTEITTLIDEYNLELATTADQAFEHLTGPDSSMVEVVVMPDSNLIGKTINYFHRRTGDSIALVALARRGQSLAKRLRRQTFNSGDILLLKGDAEILEASLSSLNLLTIANRNITIGRPKRILSALCIFAAALVLGVTNIIPLALAFVLAIGGFVLAGILAPRQIYDEVDWPVIVLIGAMIPVGRALESTGTTVLIASSIVDFTSGMPTWGILTIVLIVTMLLTDVINNAATALVMSPIAYGIAVKLNLSPDAFLMAIAIGASSAFLTPIGHQSNTLVMGPGGYKFTDYWRMGLLLDVLIIVVAIPALMYFWL